MFGYLRPLKDELKMKDYQLYKSVYCGLCRKLKKDFGLFASMTLSYDCTVLAMLYMSVRNDRCSVKAKRCTFNPIKKCMLCESEGNAFAFAGAVSVIMSYHKLNDTMNDGGLLKKTAAFFLRLLLLRNYRKACRAYPEIDKNTAEMMKKQLESEIADKGIDSASEPTARLISELCRHICPSGKDSHVLEVFGYYVGRWIYLMDACDDIERDIKDKNYNPFKKKYYGNIENTMKYCNDVLNMTSARIVMSYELLELNSYKAILDNIIYSGLSAMQKKLVTDRFDKSDKRKADYYNLLDSSIVSEKTRNSI